MKINTPHPDRGHLAFPHFDVKYKCCCETVHVKLVYLAVEVFCIVLLFIAVSKNKKIFLLPFGIYQALSLIICATLAVLCIWVMFDSNNFVGAMIKESIVSKEEMEMEKIKPELEGKMMIRMAAAFLATAFILSFFVSVISNNITKSKENNFNQRHIKFTRCYKYFADMEKHHEPYDTTVMYNVQNEGRVVIVIPNCMSNCKR
uniref:Uncharacterized protein n=1 Tax=Heterorhabditis bacteriophora TaxID=37862 RepID=A0A1I7X3V3_HETBA